MPGTFAFIHSILLCALTFILYGNTDGKNDRTIDALYWVVSKHTRTTNACSFQGLQLDELI